MDTVFIQFKTEEGELTGPPIQVSKESGVETLNEIVNDLLQNEERIPYQFLVESFHITEYLSDTLIENRISMEKTVEIIYRPEAIFRVRPVSRCTSTIAAHTAPVLCLSWSPDCRYFASGSSDNIIRIWDSLTQLPIATLEGHGDNVLCLSWSPDGNSLISGGKDGSIMLWTAPQSKINANKRTGRVLRSHTRWVTALAWEPFHLWQNDGRFVSACKDGSIRIWNSTGSVLQTISAHRFAVTCVIWGGDGQIYTASEDCSIKIWSSDGRPLRSLSTHGHWVNYLSLSTDHVTRLGSFSEYGQKDNNALERYQECAKNGVRLVSCSDDKTALLWDVNKTNPIKELVGHQQVVSQAKFSPDGRYIATVSFDKSVRLWDGITGNFIARLRGHVGSVYTLAWSADSRLFVTASKDSTVKVWNVRKREMIFDLPGHIDEVFAVDWAPNGSAVISGGKDRTVKVWKA
eukprot:TRINITY_DN157_c0_g1_i1.p1 TRINITY_DN157_c0_g1~~TRINITY_DN157_c0_g1_i1.p1  ORF type:complete len:461 (-),score=101.63 TRINITY_DN157_c0_g1_i1:448-1830(-)